MRTILRLITLLCLFLGAAPSAQGAMPAKAFAPYVDVMLYPTFSLMNCYSATGQKYYTLAFITAGGDGQPAWGGITPMNQNFMLDQINQLRGVGGDVIISFGGANGTPIDVTITSVSGLVAAYQAVINRYGLTWIDFDIEGAWVADAASIDRRNQAAKQLQASNPGLKITYCLPVEPIGLLPDGLNVINKAKAAGVNIYGVNVMAMDYGSYYAPNGHGGMGGYAISAAQNTRTQTGLNIGITPMIGQNDASDELFSLADATQLLNFAKATSYVNLLAMWSATRDNGGCPGQTWASPTCSGISQSAFAFVNTFKSFSGAGGGGNTPPSVSLTSPADGATFAAGSNISLAATASDPGGSVTQVQFYQGTTLLGTDTSSPYGLTWTNVPAGTYSLTAVATDNGGAMTTSVAVSITVGGGGGGSCAGLLVYPNGLGSYQPGQKVVSNGQIYQVKPWPYSGWANLGGPYAPGTGWAWQDAWILVGPCTN